eukprot:TRINITY_DN7537_c0_g1_i1.p2 TRINITY_DN7537_c0_g1~~TRINITY_DN7537_c0_g1_i1.p2  ORF type:complete len:198 (+),score=18.14 TRINITY_DN7537_c0_g1_i1:22-615(+)
MAQSALYTLCFFVCYFLFRFFFFNETATTEIYTILFVGSVRCVQETALQGAGGVGGLLAVTDATATYFPMYDGNGNIMTYVDASGTIQADYTYDPFGRTISQSGDSAAELIYRFSTKPLDTETNLYYYGYRYYSPDLSRWLSRDPIEEEGGVNIYGFVANSPINTWDYLGMNYSFKNMARRVGRLYSDGFLLSLIHI